MSVVSGVIVLEAVDVATDVGEPISVGVCVSVATGVGVSVAIGVGDGLGVGVSVRVGVGTGVGHTSDPAPCFRKRSSTNAVTPIMPFTITRNSP